jgi:hypothetical protein
MRISRLLWHGFYDSRSELWLSRETELRYLPPIIHVNRITNKTIANPNAVRIGRRVARDARKTADITQPDKFWLRSKSLLFSLSSLEGAFICALEAWLPMDI